MTRNVPAGAPRVHVEIAVSDVAGTRVAAAAGADRVELCSGLDLGGLTPSLALVEAAVAAATEASGSMGVHVLLRPRPGDFVHDAEEVSQVCRDADLVLRAGAAGVVVGPVTADRRVDRDALARLVDVVGDRGQLTFHRAVDVLDDVGRGVEDLVDLRVDRVLTSGARERAGEGVDRIARTVRAAAGRLAVMAGGGVRPDDVARLVAATGIGDVHLSARVLVAPDAGFGARHRTDRSLAAAAVLAARRVHLGCAP